MPPQHFQGMSTFLLATGNSYAGSGTIPARTAEIRLIAPMHTALVPGYAKWTAEC